MKHVMKLHSTPFEMIQSGRKTIELRLHDEKRRLISIGDEIKFVSLSSVEKKTAHSRYTLIAPILPFRKKQVS